MSITNIINIALDKLGADREPEPAYDSKGEIVGLVYYATEDGRHYAVDLGAVQLLAEMEGPDIYDRWCEATTPTGEGSTKHGALRVAGAFTNSPWRVLPPQDPAHLLERLPQGTVDAALAKVEMQDGVDDDPPF